MRQDSDKSSGFRCRTNSARSQYDFQACSAQWAKADLSKDRWVYVWADGVYSSIRGDNERLCALVVIGVNERGQKRFLAIEDGSGNRSKAGVKCCWDCSDAASGPRG